MKAPNLVSLAAIPTEDLWEILETARNLKLESKAGVRHDMLAGKTLAMIFQKPSLRTRVSFETGMWQLGGHAIYLGPGDIKLGQRETTEDIALNLSRYVDGIMARVFEHRTIAELAEHATVPVINGLCDRYHPCQGLADLLTVQEKKRGFEGLTLAFIGDGNNVAHSLINGCAKVGMAFRIACPEGFEPERADRERSTRSRREHRDPPRPARGRGGRRRPLHRRLGQHGTGGGSRVEAKCVRRFHD